MTALKKWEVGLRMAAYACGAAGAVLAVRARPGSGTPVVAIGLLGIMVAAFLGANGLRVAAQIRSIHRPPLLRPSSPERRVDEPRAGPGRRAPIAGAQPPVGPPEGKA